MPPGPDEDVTIIVRGERTWGRPSPPHSMSPQTEPASRLAQDNTPQPLESPEPLDDKAAGQPVAAKESPDSNPDSHPAHATPNPNKRQRTNVMTTEERLLAMPEKRSLPWRPGVDPGAEIETGGESRRKQIRFGCLLATRGDIVSVPCVSCANGRGKFSVCVANPSLFRGACAGCQLSGRPNRCSIKQSDETAQSPNASSPDSASRNVKKKALSRQPSSTFVLQPDPRRADEPPSWQSTTTRWQQDVGISQPPRPPPSSLPAAGQHWAPVNPHLSPQPPQPVAHRPNGGTTLPPPNFPNQSPMGWATVNAQRLPPPRPTNNGMESNGAFPHRGLEQDRREDTGGGEEGSGALIDSLPKNKQRQVYGLLSGLQGGIEHLQRELDSLKKALGIEDED